MNTLNTQPAPTFNHLENTKISNGYHGWSGETKVKVNGKNWLISTTKRYNGTISTHCHAVEDAGGGNYSFMMFGGPKDESFYLNVLPKGTRATEKSIKDAHYTALAQFDAKNEAGELPVVKEEEQIKVGNIIFTDHPMGNMKASRRAIYEIVNGRFGTSYKTVHIDGSRTGTDEHVRPYSQKFGIGVYFNPGETITQEEINNLLISAHQNMGQEAQAKAAQSIINSDQAKAKAEYLSQFIRADRRKTTNIIKAHILKTWPTVSKVEVKTDSFSGGDSMDVTYSAPERVTELETFINSFQEGNFNGMEDIYEYNDNAEIIMEGHILQTYKYCNSRFEEAAAPEVREAAAPVEIGNVQIIDYSDKAIAVIGDTKPIKDELKSLGGRFNFRLTCGAGWIFPKTKETELRNFLNL